MRGRGLQLEIFRDSETPDVPMTGVQTGLDRLRETVDCIEVIDNGRLITAARIGAKIVDSRYIPRSDIYTDMAMVLTQRDLFIQDREDSPRIVGSTANFMQRNPFAIAAIHISSEPGFGVTKSAIPHEIGHAVGLGHCRDNECLMFPRLGHENEQTAFCYCCQGKAKKNAYNLRYTDGIRHAAKRALICFGF